MTAEHAAAAGGEVEAHVYVGLGGCSCGWLAEFDARGRGAYMAAYTAHVTRQAAADTVLATARRLCCGDNPAPEHNARADHSQRMAFAEELARAVRGS